MYIIKNSEEIQLLKKSVFSMDILNKELSH